MIAPSVPPPTFGRYRVIAELGQGGMAEVYLAMVDGPLGSGFSKLAVVKRLRENLVDDTDFIAMLVDEARISARLNHPNVVQTLEVGVENEEYFLAMEFLDGQPLHRIQRRAVRSGQRLDRDVSLLVLADTLSGLHHAHALADYDGTPLNIVHRDVTPQNVFVTYDGTVKVVDFGIAKAAGRVQETKAGIVKGKVRYMSPEQALGAEVDRRSDVFAAGIMLWEAVTGERFWRGHEDMSIVQHLLKGAYDPSPRSLVPSVSDELDAICRKALAFSKDDRYQTADAFRADVESYLGAAMVSARRQLGPTVAALFGPERAQVKDVIERAGRANAAEPSMAALLSSASIPPASHRPRASSLNPTVSSGTQILTASTGPLPLPSLRASSPPRAYATPPPAIAPTRATPWGIYGMAVLAITGMLAAAAIVRGEAEGGMPRAPRRLADVVPSREELVVASTTHRTERTATYATPGAGARPTWTPHAPGRPAPTAREPEEAPTVHRAPAPPPSTAPPSELDAKSRRGKPPVELLDPWGPAKPR
jgi:eukaryotic-like serine/threonine-protein kinase